MKLLRRLWNRRPWPRHYTGFWPPFDEKLRARRGEIMAAQRRMMKDVTYESIIPIDMGLDWKEITLAQLLGASSSNPDLCDCSLHRLGEIVTPITIDDKDAAFIGNPFGQGGGCGNGGNNRGN